MYQEITIELKHRYGEDVAYPACATSKFFTALTGTKTLTKYHLKVIKDHGFSIKIDRASDDTWLAGLE